MDQKLLVVGIGGNALLGPTEKGTAEEQLKNAAQTCEKLVCLLKPEYCLVLTHGNGPQVGHILRQNEIANSEVPMQPLDVCVAQSEGSMGYFLQLGMLNTLRSRSIRRYVVTVITQAVVDPKDPAFKNPTKPIGQFHSEAEAKELMKDRDWAMIEDAKRGWRRVVPSPKPIRVTQRYMIRDSALIGNIIIAAGGGGVPVVKLPNGVYKGVEAVVDKDLTSAVLASSIKADWLIILTAVPHVYLNFKTPKEQPLAAVSVKEMEEYLKEGHFAEGSMKPKIEAALLFLKNSGKKAIITDIDHLAEALAGNAGTLVSP